MEAAYASFSLFFFSLQSIGEQMAAKAGTLCCSHGPLRQLCRTSRQPLILPSYSMASDAILSTETVSIVTLSLTWKNGIQNIPLGADIRGESSFQSPGARTRHSQLLWSMKHQDAHLGILWSPEEARRNFEDISAIHPLFTVEVEHQGSWRLLSIKLTPISKQHVIWKMILFTTVTKV
uniref:Translocon-associated protein subunit delta n=1 Tax=Theropithecus gelada TaxID=9565 RepID=A0A8D2FPY8_THEGE